MEMSWQINCFVNNIKLVTVNKLGNHAKHVQTFKIIYSS